jgi:glycosyltransferase involved in cell wall biosynthesis
MIVKDEVSRISDCLDPIVPLASDIVILDNESTDGTPQLLKERYGIDAIPVALSEDRCFCYSEHRNAGFTRLTTPWILCLDADECITQASLDLIVSLDDEPGVDGWFGLWRNEPEGEPPYDDYKLFLFRRGFEKRGLVHDNVQLDIRDKGGHARWLEGLEVVHRPDPARARFKQDFYRQRLRCAIRREPDWLRYHWYLGYSLFRDGDAAEAEPWLRAAAQARHPRFPVECLNARMVLAELLAAQGRAGEVSDLLDEALAYFHAVEADFEVAINFRMGGWLRAAAEAADQGRLDGIKGYRFAR